MRPPETCDGLRRLNSEAEAEPRETSLCTPPTNVQELVTKSGGGGCRDTWGTQAPERLETRANAADGEETEGRRRCEPHLSSLLADPPSLWCAGSASLWSGGVRRQGYLTLCLRLSGSGHLACSGCPRAAVRCFRAVRLRPELVHRATRLPGNAEGQAVGGAKGPWMGSGGMAEGESE